MTDAAFPKLTAEARESAARIETLRGRRDRLNDAIKGVTGQEIKATRRKRILDEAVRLHVYEEMPVLQAKMVAIENIEEAERNTVSANTYGGYATGHRGPELAFPRATLWQRFLAWAYVKLGGE